MRSEDRDFRQMKRQSPSWILFCIKKRRVLFGRATEMRASLGDVCRVTRRLCWKLKKMCCIFVRSETFQATLIETHNIAYFVNEHKTYKLNRYIWKLNSNISLSNVATPYSYQFLYTLQNVNWSNFLMYFIGYRNDAHKKMGIDK